MPDSLRASLEVTLASDPKLAQPRYAALTSLCRVFADQMDEAGGKASNRLTAAYLSALKDLQRALSEEGNSGGARDKLAAVRDIRSRPAPATATKGNRSA